MQDPKEQERIEKKIESLVKKIVVELKSSHAKFEDKDFGPNDEDEYGAISFYGDISSLPDPAGSKYPPPKTLKWQRPLYADDKFNKEGGENETKSESENVEVLDDDDEFAVHSGESDADVRNPPAQYIEYIFFIISF